MLAKTLFVLCLGVIALANAEDTRSKVISTLLEFVENDFELTDAYTSYLPTLNLQHMFRKDKVDLPERGLVCDTCSGLVDVLVWIRQNGTSREEIKKFVVDTCVNLSIEPYDVCEGLVESNIDIFLYVIDNNADFEGTKACALVLQGMGCESDDYAHWEVEIPGGSQPPQPPQPEPSEDSLRILHVSDVHYDPVYTLGAATECRVPVCCEHDSGDLSEGDPGTGYWSEYNCDTPKWLIEDSLQQMADRHTDVDIVYFTGDIISHRVWATDVYNNTKDFRDILNIFAAAFGDVPVYPIMGNHEPHPLNVWSSEGVNNLELSTQWIFDVAAEMWTHWLPEDTKETILRGGYYTVEVRKGFRIIALNSNVCYTYNWWLLHDDVDPYGQLAWMAQVLLQAEVAGERVHILSHIPSGDGTCNTAWAREFRRIIERFSVTVQGIFNGHSHKDEMLVYYPENSTTTAPFSVAFNGASLTTYTKKNPSYKIYDVDTITFEMRDFVEWTFNVTEANLTPEKSPVWYPLYSFKEAYGVDNLRPESINRLLYRMTTDHSLVEQYHRFVDREAFNNACDSGCQRNHVCDIVTSVHNDKFKCDELGSNWDV